jgi:1-deoxy-D-xylulose-5-phosphate reductoisomerase
MEIILLGATGSIGTQSLDIIRKNNEYLVGFSYNKSHNQAKKIIEEFTPDIVCCGTKEQADELSILYPPTVFVYGEDGLINLASYKGDLTIINALVGSIGIQPTIAAIKVQKRICLANKETLVVAGDFIMPLVRETGVELLPIDSEHVALHQLLNQVTNASEVYLTASGGALRDWPLHKINQATIEDVLKHPTWQMGAKITVDSGTMMNKGFEILETIHLFKLKADQIQTILHRESVVHAMVKHPSGAIIQHIAPNDMHYSIEYALYYPGTEFEYDTDPSQLDELHFETLSRTRYPLLQIAYDVAKEGGILPCVMNAANEAAVSLFLEGRIRFIEIQSIVISEVKNTVNRTPESVEELLQLDRQIKQKLIHQYS